MSKTYKQTNLTKYKYDKLQQMTNTMKQRDRRTKQRIKGTNLEGTINFVDWTGLMKKIRSGELTEDQANDAYKLAKQAFDKKENVVNIKKDEEGDIIQAQWANPDKQALYEQVKEFEAEVYKQKDIRQNLYQEAEKQGQKEFVETLQNNVKKAVSNDMKQYISITQSTNPDRIDRKIKEQFANDKTYEEKWGKVANYGEKYKSSYLHAMDLAIQHYEDAGEDAGEIKKIRDELAQQDGDFFYFAKENNTLPNIQEFHGYIDMVDSYGNHYQVRAKSDEYIEFQSFKELFDPETLQHAYRTARIQQAQKAEDLRYAQAKAKRQFKQIQKNVKKMKSKPSATGQLHRKYGV